MNHTPFIIASYVVFFVVLGIDLCAPWLARRALIKRLRARYARQQSREAS
jgi:heme exporter protein CcmD